MNLQEKLEKKVEEYNEFVTLAEQERLVRLGCIQQLEELLKEEQADELKAESQALSDSDEADEPGDGADSAL